MKIKSIKNVDKATWKNFRNLAERNNMKMSVLLKLMVDEYDKNSKELWNEILTRKKTLTNKDALEMEMIVKKMRGERGFRDGSGI